MSTSFSLLVPGSNATGSLDVTAPFDGSKIGSVETGDRAVVERAFENAHGLYRNRDTWLDVPQRIAILERAQALMQQRRESLALEAAREGGKPLPDSLVEIDRAIDGFKTCVELARTQAGREIPMGINAASQNRLAFTRHEPIGVVLAFSAFNHPLNLIVHQVGPAVAAGCPFIVKPAEATPLSCWRIVEILHEAGLPKEWGQCLLVDSLETAGAMVADPRVGFFTFIGSGRVGWMLRSQLAPGARCALEHGGAAPVVVAADADLDDATSLLAKGGFYHAGQVCVSVQRVFAERSIARDLAQRLASAGSAMKVGDPTLPDTEVGPLIREAEVTRVDTWVREAIDGGAELVGGGKALSATTYSPTVLFDPPAGAKLSTQEVFGPVICVYPVETLDEGVARANDLPFAFQAAVFTKNIDTALRVSSRLDAAMVGVNEHTAFRVDWMPFAGIRQSGLGTGGIPYTFDDMQIEKLTVIRSKEI